MGIIDKIFGSNSKTVETIDVDNDYIDKYDDWNYMLKPDKKQLHHGRETHIMDSDGDYWMGEYDRNMVESKKERSKDSTYVGWSETEDRLEDISIDFESLFRHILLLGQAGYGKSTLMRNMMLQWINGGYGVCYIDPKGHDSKDLIEQIPEHRIDDVEYINFNLNQKDKVVFNIFESGTNKEDDEYETEIEILSSEFTHILKQESENWDSEISYVIDRIVKEQVKSQSQFDIKDCLLDIIFNENRQDEFIEKNNMNESFIKRLSQLETSKYESIFKFLRDVEESQIMDQVLTNDETNLNIGKAVQEGKILIIDTSSIYSEFERNVITKIIISRVWSTIKMRNSDYDELDPYFLCLDEYHNISRRYDLADIISQARSFKLSVFLTCQYLSQIPTDSKLTLQQMQSLLTFRPGSDPSNMSEVADLLGDVEVRDLAELDRFELKGRPYMNETQRSSININTPAEYPKIRDFDNFNSDDANNIN